MTINKFRSILYAVAKIIGDVQAATHKKPGQAIPNRIARRISGKVTGQLLGKIFPPSR